MGRSTGPNSTDTSVDDELQQWPDDYEEVRREALLRNPQRRAIVDVLAERPGLNREQLRRLVGLGVSTAAHHVNQLVEAGAVLKLESVQDGEHLYFLPDDEDAWENPRTRILFGRGEARDVALHIVENPGATSDEIAEAQGKSVDVIRWHLRHLRDHKLIASVRNGRIVESFPLTELREWAEEYGPRFADVT